MTTRPNDIAWWIVEAMRDHNVYCCALDHEPNPDSHVPIRDGKFTLTVATDFAGARITIEHLDASEAYGAEGSLDEAMRNHRKPR